MKLHSTSGLLLSLTSLLAACNPTTTPDTGAEANKLSGSLSNYTAGSATLYAITGTNGNPILAEASVNPNGSFQLTLPNPVPTSALFSLVGAECSTQATVAPSSAQFMISNVYPIIKDNTVIGYTEEIVTEGNSSGVGFTDIHRFYSTTNAQVTGTMTCSGLQTTFNLNLKTGWNTVQRTVNAVNNGEITQQAYSMFAAGTPKTYPFRSLASGDQLSVSLDPSRIQLTKDDKIALTANYNLPSNTTTPVQVVMIDPMPGLELLTTTLNAANLTAVSTSQVSISPQNLLRATRQSKILQASRVLLKPQALRTSQIILRTTNQVQRTPFEYVPVKLRLIQGLNYYDTTIDVNIHYPGVDTVIGNGSNSISQASIAAGDEQQLIAYLRRFDDLTGSVSLTLQDQATGIIASGQIQDITTTTSMPFTIKVPASTPPGTYKLSLTATHNAGVEPQGNFTVVVPAPALKLTINTPGIPMPNSNPISGTVYGGETSTISLTIQGQYSMQGPVTVTAEGLPAGVTVTPITLDLPRNGTVNVDLPLTGADNLLTQVEQPINVIVSGSNATISGKAYINLGPHRSALGNVRVLAASPTSTEGFLYIGEPLNYMGQRKLMNFNGSTTEELATLATPAGGDLTWRLALAPNGEAWILDGRNLLQYTNKQLITWPLPFSATSGITTDSQGQPYFIGYYPKTNRYALIRLNLITKTFEEFTTAGITSSDQSTELFSNPQHTRLYYYNGSYLRQINLENGQINDISLGKLIPQSVRWFAVDQQENVWFTAYDQLTQTSGLARADASGATFITSISGSGQVMVDAQGQIWVYNFNTKRITVYNPSTQATQQIAAPILNAWGILAASSVGAWWIWADFKPDPGASQSYTALLK